MLEFLRNKMKTSLFIIIFLTFAAADARATYISITTTFSEQPVQGNFSQINASISNSGDEAALNLQMSLILPDGFKSDNAYVGTLDSNKTFFATFNVSTTQVMKEGTYSLILLTEYTDANGHPFSAISNSLLRYKTYASSDVYGILESVSMSEGGSNDLALTIVNRNKNPLNIGVRLFLPKELQATDDSKSLTIDGGSEKKISFNVKNLGALKGSNYGILATIDYDKDNLHYSSFSSGSIAIREEEPRFYLYLIPVAIALVGILLYSRFRKPGSRGKK